MGEELFHTLLRNICHFIVLTLMCLTYISSFPKSSFRNIILSVSLIFLAISYILNSRIARIKNKVDPSLQKIPKQKHNPKITETDNTEQTPMSNN